ncbi:Clr5 domain-containing protein [Aspergillus transmontanensis]|uniref:Clr5 domain-containing protein n=1 Tax=Aspergillus transmontanensis TaxID=1034304 RepID=A0A5N6VKR2_9EURO|nr:Clr5 domain-containing protein [Aspergillus transmontanensis]
MDGSIPPPSAISPISPSPSTSSSIFRPRRSDDWHEYRPIIEQLYRDNQLKLRDVKRIMERDYKFHASEKQYKDRLAAWHVRKNIKAKEVHVMIRKQQKRAARGKQTGFRVAGQEVDSKRIARFVRRYGTHWDNKGRAESQSQSPPQLQSQSQPETQPQTHRSSPEPGHDKLKIEQTPASEIDDTQSLPTTTYSPSLPNDTPKTTDDVSWKDLDSFQNRLLALHETLEASMAGFIYPNEEENRTPLL